MSTKSLLQVILFLLIIIIVGGIYFLYFYNGSIKNKEIVINELDLQKSGNSAELTSNQEILDGINSKQNKEIENEVDINEENLKKSKNTIKDKKDKKIIKNKNLENSLKIFNM